MFDGYYAIQTSEKMKKPQTPGDPDCLPQPLEDRRVILDNDDYPFGKADLPLDRTGDKGSFCDLSSSFSPGEDLRSQA